MVLQWKCDTEVGPDAAAAAVGPDGQPIDGVAPVRIGEDGQPIVSVEAAIAEPEPEVKKIFCTMIVLIMSFRKSMISVIN